MGLSEKRILENKVLVEKLVDQFPEPRRTQVKEMLAGWVGEEFFLAPASQKESYHACYPGGLVEHSLRVVKLLRRLVTDEILGIGKDTWPIDVLNFVGLFHDLGKVGEEGNPYFVPNSSDWHRKQGNLYEVNKKVTFMDHAERGLFIFQEFGIKLSRDEYLAIKLHDGMYNETNSRYGMHETDLALLAATADRFATQLEKNAAGF